MVDKRQVRRDFKLQQVHRGVFAVRCAASGEAWIGSGNLESSRTGAWFGLRNGMHHNKAMQAAWNLHGPDSFQYEVLETFDDDVAPALLSSLLTDRRKHWQAHFNAPSI